MTQTLSQGYFLKSVDEDFVCSICDNIYRDPRTVCVEGHVFCNECIEQWVQSRAPNVASCPNCRGPRIAGHPKNRPIANLIQKMAVRCQNHFHGCTWTGFVESWEAHLAQCGFQPVRCPYGCAGNKRRRLGVDSSKVDEGKRMLLQAELEAHKQECEWRTMECKCGQLVSFKDTSRHIVTECPMRLVKCPSRACKVVLPFGQREEHIRTCEFVEIACPFQSMGCEVKLPRSAMARHMNEAMLQHAQCTSSSFAKMQAERDSLRSELEATKLVALNRQSTFKQELASVKASLHRMRSRHLIISPFKFVFDFVADVSPTFFSDTVEFQGYIFALCLLKNCEDEWNLTLGLPDGIWGPDVSRGHVVISVPYTANEAQEHVTQELASISFRERKFPKSMAHRSYVLGQVQHRHLTKCGQTKFSFTVDGWLGHYTILK